MLGKRSFYEISFSISKRYSLTNTSRWIISIDQCSVNSSTRKYPFINLSSTNELHKETIQLMDNDDDEEETHQDLNFIQQQSNLSHLGEELPPVFLGI